MLLSRLHVLIQGDSDSAVRALKAVDRHMDTVQAKAGGLNATGFTQLDGHLAALRTSMRGVATQSGRTATGVDKLRVALETLPAAVAVAITVPDVSRESRSVTRLSRSVADLRTAATGPLDVAITVPDVSGEARTTGRLARALTDLRAAAASAIDVRVTVPNLAGEARTLTRLARGVTDLRAAAGAGVAVRITVPTLTTETAAIQRLARATTQLRAAVAGGAFDLDVRTSLSVPIAELKELADSLDRSGRAAVRLRAHSPITIQVNNLVTPADIMRIRALADELDRLRSSNTTVSVSGISGAVARLVLLRAQLQAVQGSHRVGVDVRVLGVNALGSLIGVGAKTVGAMVKVALAATAVSGAVFAAAGAAGALTTALAAVGGGAVVGALGAVSAGAVGIVSAFAAAGAGVVAWGALAYPTLSRVTTAAGEYIKAMEDGRKALAIGDTKGVTKAVEDQAKALALLSPAQRTVVGELVTLRDQWHATARVLEQPVLSTFSTGLRTLADLLPRIVPLATGVGIAVDDLARKVQGSFQGDLFARLLSTLESEAPRVVSQFGEVGLNLGGAISEGFLASVPTMRIVMAGLVSATERLQVAASGQGFATFLAYGVSMMGPFNAAMGALTDMTVALMRGLAPLGGPGLAVLQGIGESLTAAFSGPGMAQFRETALVLLPQVGTTLSALGGAISALLSVSAPLGPVVLTVLTQLADLLANGLRSDGAAQFAANVGGLLQGLVPLLQIAGTTFGQLALVVSTALLPVLPQLVGPLGQIGASAVLVVQALVPLLPLLVQGVTLFAQLTTGLAPVITNLVDLANTILGPVVEALLGWTSSSRDAQTALALLVSAFITLKAIGPAIFIAGIVRQFLLMPQVIYAARLAVLALQLSWIILRTAVGMARIVFAAAWAAALGPVGLVILAVAAVAAAAYLIVKNWDTVKEWLGRFWGWIKDGAVGAATWVKNAFLKYHPVGLIISHWSQITDALGRFWGWIKGGAQALGQWIFGVFMRYSPVGLILSHWGQITDFFGSLPGRIRNAVVGFGTMLYNAGRNLVVGLVQGIVSLITSPVDTIRNLARRMLDAFKEAFGIHSPSRVMRVMTQFVGEGAALGLEDKTRRVQGAWESYQAPMLGGAGISTLSAGSASSAGSVASAAPARTVGGVIEAPTVHIYGASDPAAVWAELEPKLDAYYGERLSSLRQLRGGR